MAPGIIIMYVHLLDFFPQEFLFNIFIFFTQRLVYFMGVSLTAGVFITEKQQGLLDRNLVAGNTGSILTTLWCVDLNLRTLIDLFLQE